MDPRTNNFLLALVSFAMLTAVFGVAHLLDVLTIRIKGVADNADLVDDDSECSTKEKPRKGGSSAG
jgi:hypothetical protein